MRNELTTTEERSMLLVRDTRRAVAVLTERAAGLRFRAAQGGKRDG